MRRFCCSELENMMGEGKKDALRVNFDRKLKLLFHRVKVTNDAGLLRNFEETGNEMVYS